MKPITRESTPDRCGHFDGPSEPAANVLFEWSGSETRDFDTRVGDRERLPVESPKHAKRLDKEYVSVRVVGAIELWPWQRYPSVARNRKTNRGADLVGKRFGPPEPLALRKNHSRRIPELEPAPLKPGFVVDARVRTLCIKPNSTVMNLERDSIDPSAPESARSTRIHGNQPRENHALEACANASAAKLVEDCNRVLRGPTRMSRDRCGEGSCGGAKE